MAKVTKKGCFARLILWPIVLALVVVIAVVGYFVHHANEIAEDAIARAGMAALGVETTVEDVNIAILIGEAEVQRLAVANPPGFKDSHFLTVEKTDAALNLPSVMEELIEIPYVRISDIHVNLEKTLKGANYDVILANTNKSRSQDTEGPASNKRYIIRELVLSNITADVTMPIVGTTPVTIERVALNDIGSDNAGVKLKEVLGIVVRSILVAVVQRGAGLLPQDFLNDLNIGDLDVGQLQYLGFELLGDAGGEAMGISENLGGIADAIMDKNLSAEQKAQKVMESIGGQGEQTGEQAVESGKKVIEGIGGMFKKKKEEENAE